MSTARALAATAVLLLSAAAPGLCASEAELEARARREGFLDIRTNTLSYGPLLVKAFAERYPFVKVRHAVIPTSGWKPRPLFRAKKASKRIDVMLRCQEPLLLRGVDAGWFARLDDLPNWKRRPVDLEGDPRYAYFLGAPHVLVYSPSKIPDAEAPRSYEELTGPKWAGKVALREPHRGTAPGFLVEFIRSTRGDLGWYERLGRNGARFVAPPEVFSLAREGMIGLARDVELLGRPDAGELRMRMAEGELPYQFQVGHVSARAPHPAAARLFMNWLLSPEGGQKVLEENGYSVGARQLEHLRHGKVWTMDNRALLPVHDARLDEAARRFDAGLAAAGAR